MAYETHRRVLINDPVIVTIFNVLYASTILYVLYRAAIANDHLEQATPEGTVMFPTPEHHVAPELHNSIHRKVQNPALSHVNERKGCDVLRGLCEMFLHEINQPS